MVDCELIFNNTSTVPEASDVETGLVEAASSNSSNFSLPVNVSSVSATSKFCFIYAVQYVKLDVLQDPKAKATIP